MVLHTGDLEQNDGSSQISANILDLRWHQKSDPYYHYGEALEMTALV